MGKCQFLDNSRPMGRLGSGPQVVGRLGLGIWVSVSSRPVGRLGLGLGSEPHVVGRLGSGPRVGAGSISGGIFGRRVVSGDVVSRCMVIS